MNVGGPGCTSSLTAWPLASYGYIGPPLGSCWLRLWGGRAFVLTREQLKQQESKAPAGSLIDGTMLKVLGVSRQEEGKCLQTAPSNR